MVPGWKDPLTQHGWYDASSDPAQIAEWQRQYPGCNWGIPTGLSGYLVFDIDPDGLLWWKELLIANPAIRRAVDATFQVRTPRGGLHIYFVGEGPNSASRIAPGVDTRGGMWIDGKLKSGGYVVAPGSHTVAGVHPKTGKVQSEGDYTVAQNLPVQPLPDELKAILPERAKGEVHGLEKNPDLDQPRNVAWAIDLLKGYVTSGRVSKQGQGGNDLAFRVVASILDKAISPGTAYELLLEHWNEHCQPPWEDWELERIVRNAAEYSEQGKTGAKGMQSNADAFAGFALPENAPDTSQPTLVRRDRVRWIDDYASSVQDPEWLIPGLIPATGVGVMYGDTGTYKSFIALDIAATLAHGIAGQWGAAPAVHDVLFLAGEMPVGTARLRYPAWQAWHDQIGVPNRLAILPRVPYLHNKEAWDGIKLDMDDLAMRPSLIVIDTLSRLMTGMDENATKEAVMTVSWLEDLARYYECFVLCVHHTGKDKTKGARGSSALIQNPDMALSLRKQDGGTSITVKKQKDVDVPDKPLHLAVRDSGKSIILERVEDLNEPAMAGGVKNDWVTPAAITELLLKNGRVNSATMAKILASHVGCDINIVRRVLRTDKNLDWFRSGDFWEIPQMEYEL